MPEQEAYPMNGDAPKIAIDDLVETAAAGALRALSAGQRGGAGAELNARELVRSGFFVDLIIRAGGYPGPIDILGNKQFGQPG